MTNISELKHAAKIYDVWSALGGCKLRGNRGQAFWRGGNGYSVSLDFERGLWHDFVTNDGGDAIRLIEVVQGCDFKRACAWLAEFAGMDLTESRRSDNRADNNWATDLKWATWWAQAAAMIAEETLDQLPAASLLRHGPTALLRTIKLGDAALVGEYREWHRHFPELTTAMAQAGKRSDARLQRRLALWIRRNADDAA